MKYITLILCCFAACQQPASTIQSTNHQTEDNTVKPVDVAYPYDTLTHSIHVFVALCDNQFQGIVPVPDKLGNGRIPRTNLYWGAGYGISTYFSQSKLWKLRRSYCPGDSLILARLVFEHVNKPHVYLIADAYIGEYIKRCTEDFLHACAGAHKDSIHIGNKAIGIGGNARLIAYIGHDGLMEFSAEGDFNQRDTITRQGIILACASKNFFGDYLSQTGAYPLLWTKQLMCPEAYTLHDAIEAYLQQKTKAEIRNKAVAAYAKYQKCSFSQASNIFATGW